MRHVNDRMNEYRDKRKKSRIRIRILTIMACIVVFCTVYALILPAITLNGTTYCGKKEHEHTEKCYSKEVVSIEEKLVCGKEEVEPHQHTEECYSEIETESEESVQPQDEDSKEEGHDSAQRNVVQRELTCGRKETKGHVHTKACYKTVKTYGKSELTCGKKEHTHRLQCYSNPEADVETEAEWEETLADVTFTRDWVEDSIVIAKSQLGYKESTANYEVISGSEKKGYTRYGDFYGVKYGDWCAMFVSFCLNYAEVENFPLDASCDHWITQLKELEEDSKDDEGVVQYDAYKEATKEYVPERGNLIFFNWDSFPDADHIGIVVDVWTEEEKTHVRTIEGNTSNTVKYREYSIEDDTIMGYGILPEQEFYCGESAHVHDSDCYDDDGELVCGREEHVHVDACEVEEKKAETTKAQARASIKATQKAAKDNTNRLTTVSGANTKDIIEINLYDYGTDINNLYKGNKNYPGFQQDGGQLSGTSTYGSNFGNNITADLSAGISSVTNQGGNINTTGNEGNTGVANSPISGAMNSTLINGYPALSDGTSLSYLFSNNEYATKKNKESINGLFRYDEETGAYTFNSRENHAQFNAENDTFTLYKQVISSNFIWYPFGNFLPFNDIVKQATQASTCDRAYFKTIEESARYKGDTGSGSEYVTLANSLNTWINKMDQKYGEDNWGAAQAVDEFFNENPYGPSKKTGNKFDFTTDFKKAILDNVYSIDYDEKTDFFFGMEMKMKFMQPKGGLTGKDGQQPMVFYFTGDDDVWVYIDDKLFLDLSGIHRHVGGKIDFVNGVVEYYALDVATGDVSTTSYKTVKFEEILGSSNGLNEKGTFEDYSTHTFNFYYMERGAGSGVCRMNFNFPLLHKNSISVTKELSADKNIDLLGNPDFKFQVLKGDTGEELFIGSGVSYDIYDDAGNKVGTGETDTTGVFTIKAGQTAVFSNISENAGTYRVRELLDQSVFEQYGKVSVDGSDTTSNAYTDVVIESGTFKGIESPVKNVSDGNTSFKFNNNVTTAKVGSLELSKKVDGETTDAAFKFTVKLDGELLKKGMPYLVTQNGTTTEKKVTSEGIIEVSAGETATIKNILAGSKFEVQETVDSAKGYIVGYAGGTVITVDDRNAVNGTIGVEKAVQLTVTNAVNGTTVTIPGEKQLQGSDGKEYTYTMKLVEVTDTSGTTEVSPEHSQTTDVNVSGEKAEFAFTIPYTEKSVGEVSKTYFYKISELNETEDLTTKYDIASYVVEVKVSKDTDGKLAAEVVDVWKDGVEVTDKKVIFTNQKLYTLTLKKVLEVPDVSDKSEREDEFSFEIELSQNGSPVTGEFTVSKSDKADTTTLKFEDGKATVTLAAGETLTIHGLPKNVTWKICETNAEGYHVTYQVGTMEDVTSSGSTEGTTADGTLKKNTMVIFTNKASYELPENGGVGTTIFTIGGCILLGAAWMIFRKKKWY